MASNKSNQLKFPDYFDKYFPVKQRDAKFRTSYNQNPKYINQENTYCSFIKNKRLIEQDYDNLASFPYEKYNFYNPINYWYQKNITDFSDNNLIAKQNLIGKCLDTYDLSCNHFYNTKMCGVSAINTDFSESSFNNADLSSSNFFSARFKHCNFSDMIISGSDFTRANMKNSSIHNTTFVSCDFSGTKFTDTMFINVSFYNCVFDNATAFDATSDEFFNNFFECNFVGNVMPETLQKYIMLSILEMEQIFNKNDYKTFVLLLDTIYNLANKHYLSLPRVSSLLLSFRYMYHYLSLYFHDMLQGTDYEKHYEESEVERLIEYFMESWNKAVKEYQTSLSGPRDSNLSYSNLMCKFITRAISTFEETFFDKVLHDDSERFFDSIQKKYFNNKKVLYCYSGLLAIRLMGSCCLGCVEQLIGDKSHIYTNIWNLFKIEENTGMRT